MGEGNVGGPVGLDILVDEADHKVSAMLDKLCLPASGPDSREDIAFITGSFDGLGGTVADQRTDGKQAQADGNHR